MVIRRAKGEVTRSGTKRRAALLIVGGLLESGSVWPCQKTDRTEKVPVTVADGIRMNRIGGPLKATWYYGIGPTNGFASFSPDGRRFAIVVSKGNLQTNTNDYSILLFRAIDAFQSPVPRKLVTFSSSSNEEGISDVNWLQDNDTILFLGSRGTKPTQLYSIQCSSGKLKKITNHRTSLVSYAISEKGNEIVYAANSPERTVASETSLSSGFQITTELLPDLTTGRINVQELELFVKRKGAAADNRLQTRGPTHPGASNLFLSRDGRYLILKTDVTELPERWREYDDENIRATFRRKLPAKSPSLLLRYELIDMQTGKGEVLLDAPAPFSSDEVLWSPDSKSLLLCGVHLPLDVDDSVEFQARREKKFVVEVKMPSRALVKITSAELRPVRWDSRTNVVRFYSVQNSKQSTDPSQVVYYRKVDGIWEQVLGGPAGGPDSRPEIRVEQDLNVPPRIIAEDAKTKKQATLMDLNPEFRTLRFGRVEEIQWADRNGRPVSAGLIFPPDYTTSRRYPLVIQTHGFDPHGFWIDGPWPTAFAAQALANREIVVLQVDDTFRDSLDTPDEIERAMRSYEDAIDSLNRKGIIDPARVGIIGFSRTCLYVKYALTHSSQRFAAAIASDGFDGGYFEYLVLANAVPLAASESESIIGAPPFGAGLSVWLKRSPGFSLDKVETPVQLQANTPASLFAQWEWFAGLKQLDKPVDLLYLLTGTHILVKPLERLVSQGGAVDWLCFWLKGEEDSDPAKADQYVRWREFRRRLAMRPANN
jgi:dipeptidyl aminopeptidase/acylaminoacyl peptidase